MLIAPFEKLATSPAYLYNSKINGSKGLNRAPLNPSEPIVNTDIQAAAAFLDVYKGTPTMLALR
jgi:hypothetical protein